MKFGDLTRLQNANFASLNLETSSENLWKGNILICAILSHHFLTTLSEYLDILFLYFVTSCTLLVVLTRTTKQLETQSEHVLETVENLLSSFLNQLINHLIIESSVSRTASPPLKSNLTYLFKEPFFLGFVKGEEFCLRY